jgi:hypothetical protein
MIPLNSLSLSLPNSRLAEPNIRFLLLLSSTTIVILLVNYGRAHVFLIKS